MKKKKQKTKRGFALMDPAKQKEIAARGGKSVSRDREHMAAIGKKGGAQRARNVWERKDQEITDEAERTFKGPWPSDGDE